MRIRFCFNRGLSRLWIDIDGQEWPLLASYKIVRSLEDSMPVGPELASCTLYKEVSCCTQGRIGLQVKTSPLALALALALALVAAPVFGPHGRGALHAAGDPLVGAGEVGPVHADDFEVGAPVLRGLLALAPLRLQPLQPVRQLAVGLLGIR